MLNNLRESRPRPLLHTSTVSASAYSFRANVNHNSFSTLWRHAIAIKVVVTRNSLNPVRNSLSDQDDRALLLAMKAGDASALSIFYDRYAPLILALLNRILFNREEAEELLCDVYLEFWRRAVKYDDQRSSPRSYLILLARSRAIDRLRCRASIKTESLNAATNYAAPQSEPPRLLELMEQSQRIKAAMSALTLDQRQALEAAYYDGLSHDEIARKFDKPLGTVKTYIRQAIVRLRTSMSPDEPSAS
jgi:RNA polymerase sigma-70 factor (ECF subfamily)